MELNHAAMLYFRTLFTSAFNSAFNVAEPDLEKIAIKIDTGRVEQAIHRWMLGIPGVREFIGARQVNNVNTGGITVVNRLWEDTIGIKRVDLERDQYRMYEPLVSRLGQVAKLHRDELGFPLLSAMLATGTRASYTSYDGIAFYGNHTTTGLSNGVTRVSTAAFNNVGTAAAFGEGPLTTAFSELHKRKDTQGHKLFVSNNPRPLVCIPPDLKFPADMLANLSFIVGVAPGASHTQSSSNMGAATENVLKGSFDILVSAYLSSTTEYHVTFNDGYMKPLIFQMEQEIELLPWERFLHEWAMFDEYLFGTRSLYNVAPGLPEAVWASVGA
jgi:phage major head subunit gpT-like protein